jgi:hypothetical protein
MAQITVTPKNALVGALAVAVVGLGIALGVTLPAPACLSDPAPQIAKGGLFDGQGNCYTTTGIVVPSGSTVENATFDDPVTSSASSAAPILRIKDASNVTVTGVTLNGQNTSGGRNIDLVGQAGVEVVSSENVNLSDIAVNHVFGDGLTLAFQPRHPPSSSVTVDGYAVNGTGAARQGVTLAYVNGATLSNVSIQNSSGIDFESDLSGVGSGNVTFDAYTGSAGVRLIEALSGPVVFNGATFSGNVTLTNQAANGQAVDFAGGTILLKRSYNGIPPAGLWVQGPGNLTLTGVTVGRQPGSNAATGAAWNVTGGGHLSLIHSPVTPPLGSNDATSVVTIVP